MVHRGPISGPCLEAAANLYFNSAVLSKGLILGPQRLEVAVLLLFGAVGAESGRVSRFPPPVTAAL